MKLSEKIQEALREQQEIHLSDPAVQWGYVPAGAQPAPIEMSITTGALSEMFLSLDGHDKDQPGYEWRKGWNDAIRQAMDYAHLAPSVPDGFAWPECPKRRQSHVLFDDGYEEGWAACVATGKEMLD